MRLVGEYALQTRDEFPRELVHDGAGTRHHAIAAAFMAMHRYAQRRGFLVGLGMRHHGVEHRHPALQTDEVFTDPAGDQAGIRGAVLSIDHCLDRPQRGAERAAGAESWVVLLGKDRDVARTGQRIEAAQPACGVPRLEPGTYYWTVEAVNPYGGVEAANGPFELDLTPP